jgi:hypothetical protein
MFFQKKLKQKLEDVVKEINSLSAQSLEYPHSFGMRFVEFLFQETGANRLRFCWRSLSSIRAHNYSKRIIDTRGSYFSALVRPADIELDIEEQTFEGYVLEVVYLDCYHHYRTLLSQYAEFLGIPSNPLTGEYFSSSAP